MVFLIGRILYGGYFLWNGINYFRNLEMLTGYARSEGTPAPKVAVAGTGVLLLLAGLSALLGAYPVVGVILLVIFPLGVSVKTHDFWAVQGPQMKMIDMINFTKNTAVLGAALMTVIVPKPWPVSLTLR